MSFAPFGPQIDLRCGAAMMGDEVTYTSGDQPQIALVCTQVVAGDTITLISERGIEHTRTVAADQTQIALTQPWIERRFARVEIWRYFAEVEQTLLAALSNPIYFRADDQAGS